MDHPDLENATSAEIAAVRGNALMLDNHVLSDPRPDQVAHTQRRIVVTHVRDDLTGEETTNTEVFGYPSVSRLLDTPGLSSQSPRT